jgi:hypothetical protein
LQTANDTVATRDAAIAEHEKTINKLKAAAGAPSATVLKESDGEDDNNDEPENTYQNVRNILKGVA